MNLRYANMKSALEFLYAPPVTLAIIESWSDDEFDDVLDWIEQMTRRNWHRILQRPEVFVQQRPDVLNVLDVEM
ncbi:hypothetical protein ACH5Y9_20605 [Methylomonas sp. BW4-1]|uniref:Uncharacterized protein n=1 Tax=Methylomonas defluvii TaxID=3045149 RepID=A0ABU4ULK5_9GAMM|nr:MULTISPECIES: hypothetical protein [unclassified Methylomonas]MDX8130387.1 hypothetical protein [Methylomonas sp. OY6]NOV31749.1 hypothetical protein [Methylomonas sp. ZR1]PKD39206.1 hypothetical protein CWO84_15905 [Methylomonas sp. Kb3]QBC25509.1 hypothetical protein U737_00510 [Methylomonas sp. LW13]QSB01239.1 hypothetical protein JWZ98_21815 [Methylomonas sp. EFPC1]